MTKVIDKKDNINTLGNLQVNSAKLYNPKTAFLNYSRCEIIKKTFGKMFPELRTSQCGFVPIPGVKFIPLVQRNDERPFFSSLVRCANGWLCPTCSRKIMFDRYKLIETIVNNMKENFNIYFVTLTLPHTSENRLFTTLQNLIKGFNSVNANSALKRFKINMHAEYIRVLEITYNNTNGFHPHLHFMYFIDKNQDEKKVNDFFDKFKLLWIKKIVSMTMYQNIHDLEKRSFVVEHVNQDIAVSKYLVKWNIYSELVLGIKKGNSIYDLIMQNDEKMYGLIYQYAINTRRKRQIQLSEGISKKYKIKNENEIIKENEKFDRVLLSVLKEVYKKISNHTEVEKIIFMYETEGLEKTLKYIETKYI